MNILFITESFPHPLDSGGKIVSYQMLQMLSSKHKVHLICLNEANPNEFSIKAISKLGIKIDVICSRKRGPWYKPSRLSIIRSILSLQSTVLQNYSVARMHQLIHSILLNEHIDIVHVEHLSMAQYFPRVKRQTWILQEQNIEYKLYEDFCQFSPKYSKEWLLNLYNAWALSKYEKSILKKVDKVIVLSESEKSQLQSIGISHHKILAIPPYIAMEEKREELQKNRKELLFIGNLWWKPNHDAIIWFLEKIYPLVLKKDSSIRLTIVGEGTGILPEYIRNLSTITIIEKPDHIDRYLKRASVFIMPFRIGQGVRIKALTALSQAVPIVSTFIGMRGLKAIPGVEYLRADTPEGFASDILHILSSQALKHKLTRNGLNYIQKYHDKNSNINTLHKTYATGL